MNRKEGIIVATVILASFMTGVFAVPEQQILNVFVTNFPAKSHLGQSTAEHVTLHCIMLANAGALPCNRALPDGTILPFSIPVGSNLVVTDVSWSAGTAKEPGMRENFGIFLRSPDNQTSLVFVSTAIVSTDGTVLGGEHMTAGFVVSSAATMMAETTAQFGLDVLLHGYLAAGD